MINPLVDIEKISAEELQNKISELTRRLMYAHQANASTFPQLAMLLETYKAEMDRRTVEKSQIDDPNNKSGVVLDTGEESDHEKDNLDKLIDIG